MEDRNCFEKCGRDVGAIIGTKNDRKRGRVTGFKDNGITTKAVENRVISVDMACPGNSEEGATPN